MMKILVVDDEPKIVEVLEAYLKVDGYKVIVAYSGKEALKKFQLEKVDLIILDLMLPDISGEKICEEIRKTSDVSIIMLTAKIQEDNVLEGFSLGADDYVTKPFSPKQLLARVKAVLKRSGTEKKNKLISFNNGDLTIDIEGYNVMKCDKSVDLTPSEYKILLALSKSPNKVFTRSELLDLVIGDEVNVYDRIIDSHIKNLRSKIEDNTRSPKYILTVHGVGYRFGGEIID